MISETVAPFAHSRARTMGSAIRPTDVLYTSITTTANGRYCIVQYSCHRTFVAYMQSLGFIYIFILYVRHCNRLLNLNSVHKDLQHSLSYSRRFWSVYWFKCKKYNRQTTSSNFQCSYCDWKWWTVRRMQWVSKRNVKFCNFTTRSNETEIVGPSKYNSIAVWLG